MPECALYNGTERMGGVELQNICKEGVLGGMEGDGGGRRREGEGCNEDGLEDSQ